MNKALIACALLATISIAATIDIGSDGMPNSKPFCGD
jgi:hypothetical protein